MTNATPECSLGALQNAAAQGYYGVELDVRMSLDGTPVWFHDATLDRMTGLTGPVVDQTIDKLLSTRLLETGEQIQPLSEAIRTCSELGLGVMLDIKREADAVLPPEYLKKIAEVLSVYEGPPVLLITTDPTICRAFSGVTMPMVTEDQMTGLSHGSSMDLRGYFWFGLPRQLTDEQTVALREAGALIVPAINSFRYDPSTHAEEAEKDICRMFRLGVDTFQIDSVYGDQFRAIKADTAPTVPPDTPELRPYAGPRRNDIDSRTIDRKVMVGYQGWFRTPGDGVVNEWVHWSIDPQRVGADSLTVEMWPDMTEYPASERVPVPGMRHADGSEAQLFSSIRPSVIDLHFDWMRQYKIDGVFVQRFLTDFDRSDSLRSTGVLAYARNAANRTGRTFALTYDMSGTDHELIFDKMVDDWKFLVDRMELTRDPRYLHHNGKPVLMIWGFFPDRFDAALAHRIIDFFKNDPRYGVTLIGGVWRNWRGVTDPGWRDAYRRFDIISPWNTGRYVTRDDGVRVAETGYLAGDIVEACSHGMDYLPVIYPGFSWDNLQRARGRELNESTARPRRGGAYLWEQFVAMTGQDVRMLYLAMFDEVDEGTAIFKVTNNPPVNVHFVTYEGLPSDWYLRLTCEGTRMFRGDIPVSDNIPIKP